MSRAPSGVTAAQAAKPGPAPITPPAAIAAIDPLRLLRAYYPWFIGAAVFGLVLGVILFVLFSKFMPKYTATVTFQALGAGTAADTASGSTLGSGSVAELEKYMASQVFVMKSDIVLRQAAESAVIRNTSWAKKYTRNGVYDAAEALKGLRDAVSARALPDTNIMQMSMATSNPNDSANIINEVARAYEAHNKRSSVSPQTEYRDHLDRQVRQLRAEVSDLDRAAERLLGGGPDADRAAQLTSLNQQSTEYFVELQQLQPALTQLRQQLSSTNEQLQRYEALMKQASAPGEAGVVYPEEIRAGAEQGQIIQQMDGQIAVLKADLRAARVEFGDNHREVQRLERTLQSRIDERKAMLDQKTAELFAQTVQNLRNAVSNLTATGATLEDRLEQAKKGLNDVTLRIKQYEDIMEVRKQKLESIADFERQMAEMTLKIDQGERVEIITLAPVPDEKSFPKVLTVIAPTAVLCVGLVGGVILLKEVREQRIRSPQDIAMIPRTRVLGVVPELKMDPSQPERAETASRDKPQGAFAESMRQIRTAIVKEATESDAQTILFVGGMPGSGSSSIVTNLAFNLGAIDKNVLVIDANIRRPSLHRIFGVPQGPGLAEVLTGSVPLSSAVQATSTRNVSILAAGTATAGCSEKLTPQCMGRVLEEARGKFDMILLDAAPAVVAGDAFALASLCDAAVLVVKAYSEKRGLVVRLRNQLGDSRAKFLGVIVNAIRPSAGGYLKRNLQATMEYQQPQPAAGAKA